MQLPNSLKETFLKIVSKINKTQASFNKEMEELVKLKLISSCANAQSWNCEDDIKALIKTSARLENIADTLLEKKAIIRPDNTGFNDFQISKIRAPFIVIDGPDGSGKSSLIKELKSKYADVVFTKDPGGTSESSLIRSLILDDAYELEKITILLLFLASRYETQTKVVIPSTLVAETVISDRWGSSTFAYQNRTEGLGDIIKLLDHIFIKPDYFILLDVDPKEGIERAYKRAGDNKEELRYENKGIEYLESVRVAFKLYKSMYFTESNSITIDTNKNDIRSVVANVEYFLKSKRISPFYKENNDCIL